MYSAATARIALVAASFSRDAMTRSDRFAFEFATHLALAGVRIEVLTTCARSSDPEAIPNYYRSGLDTSEAFPVHRFRAEEGDRSAYRHALVALTNGTPVDEDVLIDERTRSPHLLAHLRSVAERYDAFLFTGVTAATTVRGVPIVEERAAIVPLLTDDPLAHLDIVRESAHRARMLLFTTEAEAALALEWYGAELRPQSRVIGLGVDVVPPDERAPSWFVERRRGRPYIVSTNGAAAGSDLVPLETIDPAERETVLARAAAVDLGAARDGFCPELFAAWAHGKPVIADARTPGAAPILRETGAGWLVNDDDERAAAQREALAATPEMLARLAESGRTYVETRMGWHRAAIKTAEAIDAFGAVDDGRTREAALAQLSYLLPLMRRQRRTIAAMQVSRFWRARNAWFALKRRLRIGPADDPIPDAQGDAAAVELAAFGDPYFLFREQHRLRPVDVDRMRAMISVFPLTPSFGLVLETAETGTDGLHATIESLRTQLYERWRARIVVDADHRDVVLEHLAAYAGDERIVVTLAPIEDEEFVGALRPGDLLEPHALFELALALNRQPELDAIYTDEDVLDERGRPSAPYFKPDWSPETHVDRDYVGRLCIIRRAALDAAGGLRPVFGSATWYEALLRVSEGSDRIGHVAQVLYHRRPDTRTRDADMALALEVALQRRGEAATIVTTEAGLRVRYAVPGDERVAIVIPTRDRSDLLGPCLESLFGRTTYRNIEVVLVDNGSRESATVDLLRSWLRREPHRFRVLRDDDPFNFPRLNNLAAAATTAEYLLFLNNDTVVVAPDWVEAMLAYARRPQIGAVGAMLLYPDDTVQHAGVVLGVLSLAGHAHRYLPASTTGYHGALQRVTNYAAVTAACMMVARKKYFEVGGLDETFAVSYNDVDFCLRLLRHGYRNVYVPQARLYHFESKSRGVDDNPIKVARAMREFALMHERWPHYAARDPYYNPNLTSDAEDFSIRL
jgi:GT2 family glycosyltransferase